jgi:hypothetical protein
MPYFQVSPVDSLTAEQINEISAKIFQKIMHVKDIIGCGTGAVGGTGILLVGQVADYRFVLVAKSGSYDELRLA